MSVTVRGDAWEAAPSSGGLASALRGAMDRGDALWVGWPGASVAPRHRAAITADLRSRKLHPVFVSAAEEEHYYHGISNQVIWPLFHYFADKVEFTAEGWRQYVTVNRRFAETLAEVCADGGQAWIHDFHLMLVPSMLRELRPDLEIGFFLHIPFPSSEIYRLLPAREELLRGVLGADFIGFHTHGYARHFRSSCLRVLGLESDHRTIQFEGRVVRVGAHPIGIDVEGFDGVLRAEETARLCDEYVRRYAGRRMLLGVERLDYTKGVKQKLQAFERFLQRDPSRAEHVTLLQVLVPSRLDHPDYRRLKSDIEEYIGSLNGRFGRPGRTPIEYLHRSLSPEELVALYRCADVCLVTPVRDGMNLVAQEYVHCQGEQAGIDHAYRGVLVLSEFAGSAHYLQSALLANPWDLERTADTIDAALAMSREERRARMVPMIRQVANMDCRRWVERFLAELGTAARANVHPAVRALGGGAEDRVVERFAEAQRRVLLLDYDGTLRELARTPEEAAPSRELLALLAELAADERNEVHIVSGRDRRDLDRWFDALPLWLCAEHGFACRSPSGDWSELGGVDFEWLGAVAGVLEEVADDVAGARVERKPSSVAWHYRMADLDYGVWRARELLSQLEQDLAHLPVEVVQSHRVIEVRAAGIHKGAYVRRVVTGLEPDTLVVCAGDDPGDGEMYRELPAGGVSIHVGGPVEEAEFSVSSPQRIREILRRFGSAPSPTRR